MSAIIIDPVLTDEIIVRIFEHLCLCELRKILSGAGVAKAYIQISPLHQEGLQDGYITCLSDLFGAVDDSISESMHQREKTYLHVVDQIMDAAYDEVEELKDDMEHSPENKTFGVNDLGRIEKISVSAVRSYFTKNKQDMVDAIKFL